MCGTLTWTIILSVLSVQPHSQIQCVPLTLGAVHHPWTLLMLSVDTHRKWLFPAPVALYSSPGKGHTSKWHQQQGHRRQRSCVYQSALLPRQPPCDYCIPEELHTATSSHLAHHMNNRQKSFVSFFLVSVFLTWTTVWDGKLFHGFLTNCCRAVFLLLNKLC